MPEKQLFFDSEGYSLYGVLYTPPRVCPGSTGVLICHPFAEEKKVAQNVLVELARVLCAQNFPVLLFDLRGCGDSGGDLSEATISAWHADIRNAAQVLQRHAAVARLGAVGVRLGTFVCATLPEPDRLFDLMVLVEPVLDPVKYLRQSLRGKLVKELITAGAVASSRDGLMQDLENKVTVDFDGHPVSPAFYQDALTCKNRCSGPLPAGFAGDLFMLPVSATGRVPGELGKAAAQWMAGGRAPRIVPVLMEPFWLRFKTPDCRPLMQTVSSLLAPYAALPAGAY